MTQVVPSASDHPESVLDEHQLMLFEQIVAQYECDWYRDPSIRWQDYLPDDTRLRACLIAELSEIEAEFVRKRAPLAADTDSSSLAIQPESVSESANNHFLEIKAEPSSERVFRAVTNYGVTTREIHGGLGDVFVIRDRELGRIVVVKQLQKRWQGNSRAVRAFQREVRITSRLEHPCIVPVHSVGTTPDGLPFYSMRYIEGKTLQEAILELHASSRLNMTNLRSLLSHFIQVCRTLAFAHARGILHRDLKPANIVIGNYGETLVLDWGLAKELCANDSSFEAQEPRAEKMPVGDELAFELQADVLTACRPSTETTHGDVVGTPAYISPEQAAGDISSISIRTDVFGLGAVLYAILFGKPPYIGSDSAETIRLASQVAVDFNFTKSSDAMVRGLLAICRKAMSREPRLRYADAQSLADDLETWLAGESISIQRQPLTQRCIRFASGQRTLASLAGISLIAAIVAIVVGANSVRVERSQRQLADTQANANAQVAQEVAEYIAKVYRSADPIRFDDPGFAGLEDKSGRSMHKAILDSGYELIQTKLKQHPKQSAELLLSLGSSYRGIGEYERAAQALHEAYSLREAIFGSADLQTLQCDYQLGRLAYETGNYKTAESTQRKLMQTIDAQLASLDIASHRVRYQELLLLKADAMSQLGWLLYYQPLSMENPHVVAERIAESHRLLRQVVEIREKFLSHNHRSVGLAYAQLAAALMATKETEAEAVAVAATAMEIFNKTTQESTFGSFLIEYTRAESLRQAGKYEAAEGKYLELLEFIRSQVGQRHPLVAVHMWNMVGLYRQHGYLDKTEQTIREIRDIAQHLPNFRSSHTHLDCLRQYGEALHEKQRCDDARNVYTEILRYAQERPGQYAALVSRIQSRLDSLPPSDRPEATE